MPPASALCHGRAEPQLSPQSPQAQDCQVQGFMVTLFVDGQGVRHPLSLASSYTLPGLCVLVPKPPIPSPSNSDRCCLGQPPSYRPWRRSFAPVASAGRRARPGQWSQLGGSHTGSVSVLAASTPVGLGAWPGQSASWPLLAPNVSPISLACSHLHKALLNRLHVTLEAG